MRGKKNIAEVIVAILSRPQLPLFPQLLRKNSPDCYAGPVITVRVLAFAHLSAFRESSDRVFRNFVFYSVPLRISGLFISFDNNVGR